MNTDNLESSTERESSVASSNGREPKRAICLAGGGPAAGLHIGALEGLKDCGVEFNKKDAVWALSCIGAWVGVVYNQAKGDPIKATREFFEKVFRDDESFQSFPVNTIFAPDLGGNANAIKNFLFDLENYKNAILPEKLLDSFVHTMSLLSRRPKDWKFSKGDYYQWMLNHVMAVHPAVRFWTALVYKSEVDGKARIYYPDSKFLTDIRFNRLLRDDKPYIFYNAWNLSRKRLQLFSNKKRPDFKHDYKDIGSDSLCACSALPYVEQTVKIDGDTYCEGALRDTVNFESLLEDHHRPDQPIDEIWINRIVDAQQIREPKNLHDALANLCEMFAATVGEDDVKLFKFHVKEEARKAKQAQEEAKKGKQAREGSKEKKDAEIANVFTGLIVELRVNSKINFEWSHSNLEQGRERGLRTASATCKLYNEYRESKKRVGEVLMIPDDLSVEEIGRVLRRESEFVLTEEEIAAVNSDQSRAKMPLASLRSLLSKPSVNRPQMEPRTSRASARLP